MPDFSTTIVVVEDDDGHATLIQKNLRRAGISNTFLRFEDGQQVLDFLRGKHPEHNISETTSYIFFLDIRMPKIDGIEVLRQMRDMKDTKVRRIPIFMLTTTDSPAEITKCHELGCSNYIKKPIDYENFVDTIKKLGLFLQVIEVPSPD